MSCDRYATAIADHACGADLAPDVAAHLTACPACAAGLVQQRRAIAGLDDELQQMLAIAPSPFFVQRVQAQVRETSSPRRVRGLWWGGVAAAAVIVLAVLFLTVERQPPAAIQVQAPPTAKTPPPTPAAPPIDGPRIADVKKVLPTKPLVTEKPRVVSEPLIAKAVEPEVQVAPGQRQAVARYMALVRSGRLDTSSLEAKVDEDSTPKELVLGALEIAPITVTELDGTTSPAVDRRHQEEQPK
jgi:hypothetical protein